MSILCLLLDHLPDRSSIWDDGLDFRSSCRRCGTALLKDYQHGWRAFDPEIDNSGRGKLRATRRSTAEGGAPSRREGKNTP